MNYSEKEKDFYKRWDINYSINMQEEFEKFKIRFLNVFSFNSDYFYSLLAEWFLYYIWKKVPDEIYQKREIFYDILKKANHNEFLEYIEIISDIDYSLWNNKKKDFIRLMKSLINQSCVDFELVEKTDWGILFYPKWEKKFDDELVNQTLKFLNPESSKHFEDALNFYMQKKFIKSAEELRRTIEEFFKYKLSPNKTLANNMNELQQKLKAKWISTDIRNIIKQTFSYLDNYFNENTKHGDGDIDEIENEFLIYQVWVLLRYIDREIDKLI